MDVEPVEITWKHRNTTWKLNGQDLTHSSQHGERTIPIGMKLRKKILADLKRNKKEVTEA